MWKGKEQGLHGEAEGRGGKEGLLGVLLVACHTDSSTHLLYALGQLSANEPLGDGQQGHAGGGASGPDTAVTGRGQ
ncbi:hypothetical protein KUCAC02_007455 [Chaenocephalus aceratus]|uniref:Uncharacterized protein n=1 Tax=Chaenocephalus aceratus TaxID=36190 RepID=A0ACB9X7D2_CHAAC|nr:hypothetical protein KUCAC02_007455 [Chaenocephalus aceratus]